ncbi:hypothetical protein [Methanohalophilus euhalobius]|uniref:Uncharacterized protein n=1 Tax=Methanohalophilus euhalobius TaxID=51203 RepID=A0A314ZQ84_9EURY|nr:hypothetical protein [Methanohalophilus euhalobius]PQV43305.1 hypothetical protein B0H22_10225 [Methanohalophilus euhalobius]
MARLLKHMHWAAYDVLWLATFVDLDAVPENDESTKLAMNTLSDTYFGVTGWTKLDENGDRVHWDYDIWAISENNGNYDLSKTLYFIVVH